MESVVMLFFVLVIMIGCGVQFIDGSLGMGYGATSSSFLLSAGLAPVVISASVHAAEIFASLASGISHLKFGNVEKRIVLPLVITGVIGGVLGAYFLVNLPAVYVKPVVGIILLFLGIRIFLRFSAPKRIRFSRKDFSKRSLLGLGLAGGTMDAFGGGGWGPICTTSLVSANRKEPRYIIGSVNLAEFFVTVAIVITFIVTIGPEQFLWYITLPLIIGGVLAAPLAAYFSSRVTPRTLGISVGMVLIMLNFRTVVTGLPELFGTGPVIHAGFELDVLTMVIGVTLVSIVLTTKVMKRQIADELKRRRRQRSGM